MYSCLSKIWHFYNNFFWILNLDWFWFWCKCYISLFLSFNMKTPITQSAQSTKSRLHQQLSGSKQLITPAQGSNPSTGKTSLRGPLTPLVPSPTHRNLLKCSGMFWTVARYSTPPYLSHPPAATLLGVERDVGTQHVFPKILGPNY